MTPPYETLPLVPRPRSLERRPGRFPLTPDTALRVSPGAGPAAAQLRRLTGLPLRLAALAEAAWSTGRDLADFRRRTAAPALPPLKEEHP